MWFLLLPINLRKMPKHPTSPPYRSSLVVSRSKETEKHMTTVPKPVAHSRWKTWKIKNRVKWK